MLTSAGGWPRGINELTGLLISNLARQIGRAYKTRCAGRSTVRQYYSIFRVCACETQEDTAESNHFKFIFQKVETDAKTTKNERQL